jgi:hypothetical protein
MLRCWRYAALLHLRLTLVRVLLRNARGHKKSLGFCVAPRRWLVQLALLLHLYVMLLLVFQMPMSAPS